MKRIFNHIFIDGLSGMASGLFATLIIGTMISQLAGFIGGRIGFIMGLAAAVAKMATGAGIGVAVACKFGSKPLVAVSAGVCGMIGAHASALLSGAVTEGGGFALSGPGDPLGAFVAAFVGIEIGNLVSGRTGIDIILTPLCAIGAGAAAGFAAGPPISRMMAALGSMIMWATEQQPFVMGIIVSVVMGILLTLPISSAAIGIMLGLDGIAGGAAAIGCCTHMIGFAAASFRENGISGLASQGVGTSMLQMPNIVRKPVIALPVIMASAILGPVGTCLVHITCNPVGCGMGNAGFVGPIMSYQVMTAAGGNPVTVLIEIMIMYFLAPAVLSAVFSGFFRKAGWIKPGDMKLEKE